MKIEERAKVYADNYCVGDAAIIVDLIHRCALESYTQGATEQKEIDIEQIPQLYVRWLMIDGDKPSWKEYAIKAMGD